MSSGAQGQGDVLISKNTVNSESKHEYNEASFKTVEKEYAEKKKKAEAYLWDKVKQAWPVVFPKIIDLPGTSYCTSSPGTSAFYLNSNKGCSYGLSMNPPRFDDYEVIRTLRPDQTEVAQGLFLSGQDILMPGVVTQLGAGMLTSQALVYPGLWSLVGRVDSWL